MKEKVALMCDIREEAVIEARDVTTLYEVPLKLPILAFATHSSRYV